MVYIFSIYLFDQKCMVAERERERGERKVTNSLIKDVSKTLIKIDYPHKCSTTCYLWLIHLEPLSQFEHLPLIVSALVLKNALCFYFIFHTFLLIVSQGPQNDNTFCFTLPLQKRMLIESNQLMFSFLECSPCHVCKMFGKCTVAHISNVINHQHKT